MRPEILNPLFMPVTNLNGVGPKLGKLLDKLLVRSDPESAPRVIDLLFHLPVSVIDRRYQPNIEDALHGQIATLKVHIDRHFPTPRGKTSVPYRINAHDETGEISIVYFRANSQWMEKLFPVGETRYISGKIEWYNDAASMVHPDFAVTQDEFDTLNLIEPVYPATAGLSQKILGKSVHQAISDIPKIAEWGNRPLLEKQNWPDFITALTQLHRPQEAEQLEPQSEFRKRLAYDEYLSGQLALYLMRKKLRKQSGRARQFTGQISSKLINALPFNLTTSQKYAIEEINGDLRKGERMLRLMQGDVGAGKTIVALLAITSVIEDGAQGAIMAPTEVLARQHLQSISPLCNEIGLRVEILTGREKGKQREQIYEDLKSGVIDILIGTHALFQSKVIFKNLGLAIIDEQHRFGVVQRLMLADKGTATDILVMTATPIPRTLVMTSYGDMDISELTEKPDGRKPIGTSALAVERIDDLMVRINNALENGQKIFWICPLVDESEKLDLVSAQLRFEYLQENTNTSVGLIHGRMGAAEKDEAMASFRDGKTRLLVATTVVEVGVDISDATIMIIEHSERFGLAQLHQLRGRVGRGSEASHCILLYKSPLSQTAKARLNIMRESDDGFKIAEEDLRLRGEGEILGSRQSGQAGYSFAINEFHAGILEMARDDAKLIVETDPNLTSERGEALRQLLYLFSQDQAIRLIRSG